MFKKTLVAAALLTAIAAPAFAQSYDPDIGSGNIAVAPGSIAQAAAGPSSRVWNAYAQAPVMPRGQDLDFHVSRSGAGQSLFLRAKGNIE